MGETIEIYSTRDQLEEFRESVIWKDIVRELESWLQGFNIERDSIVDSAEKENPSTASVLLHLGDLNGRSKAVEYMLSIPDLFISILSEKAEEKSKSKPEVSNEH